MSGEDNSSYVDLEESPSEIAIPRLVRFWIILPFYIPSIICSLFVLYHFIFNRALRQALHNHVIIILLFIILITQLTNIPWILNYYRLGYVWPQNPSFCLVWIFIDEALCITTTVLFAWATIERHILIFHDQLVATKYKYLFFHCFPIIIILLYCMCYNIIVIIVPPCKNIYDYTQLGCGYSICYYEVQSLSIWDVVTNDLIPTIVIMLVVSLFFYVFLYQKHRMHQPIRWRQHRKMMIQLLLITVLYLILYIPRLLMEFVYRCGVSEEFGADFMLYVEFFGHYGNLLLPFICAASMPELETKIKKMFSCWRRQRRTVGPQTLVISRRVNGRQVNTNALT